MDDDGQCGALPEQEVRLHLEVQEVALPEQEVRLHLEVQAAPVLEVRSIAEVVQRYFATLQLEVRGLADLEPRCFATLQLEVRGVAVDEAVHRLAPPIANHRHPTMISRCCTTRCCTAHGLPLDNPAVADLEVQAALEVQAD